MCGQYPDTLWLILHQNDEVILWLLEDYNHGNQIPWL
jgi:hypothetical protein